MNTPQPLGMSGEEKWYQKMPYGDPSEEKCADGSTLRYWVYDIPAILKEQRRLVLEEVNTMINKHARKEAGNDLLVVPLGIAVLGLVSLQSKDGKGE